MMPVLFALGLQLQERRGARDTGHLRGVLLAVAGGFLSCLGNIPYFHVLGSGAKAATVVPVTALYPLVTILLAVPLLKERLNRTQVVGVALSILAIYLFNVQQEEGLISVWLLLALIPVVLWGIAGLLQKISTNHIPGTSSAFWFLSAFLPVGAFIVYRQPLPESVSWQTWLFAAGLGFTLALGNFAVLIAYASNGKASIITPLVGMYPLVSIPIAICLLGERIGLRETFGVVCALASVTLLSLESSSTES
jgi:drug/metabolite transporter (DMT)-like permease